MFSADDIQARIRQQPFTPVRIVTSSGQMFDIFHPELAMVGRRYLILGTASTDNPRQFETESRVAVIHVTALENLPSPASPAAHGGNGEG